MKPKKKKVGTTLLERTFYGRKKAASDRRKKIDRGVAKIKKGEEPSRTVLIAKDAKDEAKLQRKEMRKDATLIRRKRRGVAARKPGKGLGARKVDRLQKKVNELKVNNRKKFFEEQKKNREKNRPKVNTSGLFKKK